MRTGHESHRTKDFDVELAAREIAQLLQPLAVFMSANDLAFDGITDDETHSMIRDAWFNIVVHGFTTTTERGKRYINELRVIAIHSPRWSSRIAESRMKATSNSTRFCAEARAPSANLSRRSSSWK